MYVYVHTKLQAKKTYFALHLGTQNGKQGYWLNTDIAQGSKLTCVIIVIKTMIREHDKNKLLKGMIDQFLTETVFFVTTNEWTS